MSHWKEEATARLINDYDFQKQNEKLVYGKCPKCGEKEAYAYLETLVVICPRGNKCGARTLVKAIYPDLFEARYFAKATPTNPKATADDFLISRGLKNFVGQDFYQQAVCKRTNEKGVQTWYQTVRFTLFANENARQEYENALSNPSILKSVQERLFHSGQICFNERLIGFNGKGKTNNRGSFSGKVWIHPKTQKRLFPSHFTQTFSHSAPLSSHSALDAESKHQNIDSRLRGNDQEKNCNSSHCALDAESNHQNIDSRLCGNDEKKNSHDEKKNCNDQEKNCHEKNPSHSAPLSSHSALDAESKNQNMDSRLRRNDQEKNCNEKNPSHSAHPFSHSVLDAESKHQNIDSRLRGNDEKKNCNDQEKNCHHEKKNCHHEANGKLEQVYIVEGVLDALSLELQGMPAVAILTSKTIPNAWLETVQGKIGKFIIALDDDLAGIAGAKKLAKELEKRGFLYDFSMVKNGDWNDFLLKKGFENPAWKQDCNDWGKIACARSAKERGQLLAIKKPFDQFLFDFENETFVFCKDKDQDAAAMDRVEGKVTKIGTFRIEFLASYQKEDCYTYLFEVCKAGKSTKIELKAEETINNEQFKKAILSKVKQARWRGTSENLESLMLLLQEKEKETIYITHQFGYDQKSQSYLLGKFGFWNGQILHADEAGIFSIPKYGKIKSTYEGFNEQTAFQFVQPSDNRQWIQHFHQAYGVYGSVLLGYFVASFFAVQCSKDWGYFPFLALTGTRGSGKSTLLSFIWKMFSRQNSDSLTSDGTTTTHKKRFFSAMSNIPVVLSESTKKDGDKNKFDLNLLLNAFNRMGIYATGKKTNDLQTNDYSFDASVIVEQNLPIEGTPALVSRFVQLVMNNDYQTEQTEFHANQLAQTPLEDFCQVLHFLMKHEAIINFILKQKQLAQNHIQPKVSEKRYADVHSVIYGGFCALGGLFAPVLGSTEWQAIKTNLLQKLLDLAQTAECAENGEDPLVRQFFDEVKELIDSDPESGNYFLDIQNDEMKLDVSECFKLLKEKYGTNILHPPTIKALLKQSPRLIKESYPTHLYGVSKRVWKFKSFGF